MAGTVTWYANALTGDDGNTGASITDPVETFGAALALAVASGTGDETIELQGGPGQVYTQSGVHLINMAGALTIRTRDVSGVVSTGTPSAFSRDDRPIFRSAHASASLFVISIGDLTVSGVDFDGADTGLSAISYGSDVPFEASDCLFRSFTAHGHQLRTNGIARRNIYSANGTHGIDITSASEVQFCAFLDSGEEAIGRAAGTADTIQNCAFVRSSSASVKTYPIENQGGSETITNCLFVDNLSDYGAKTTTADFSSAFSRDTSTYQKSGNWNGGTGASQFEIDPDWYTEPTTDPSTWAIRSVALAFGGTTTAELYTLDGTAITSKPPIGPMGLSLAADPIVIPRGTHSALVRLRSGYFVAGNAEVDAWTLTGGTRPPWVAAATLGGAVTLNGAQAYTDLTITTDRTLREDTDYTLTTTGTLYASESWVTPGVFSGLRPSLTGGVQSSSAPVLLDFHAPWVREDGAPGGFWEVGSDGDYKLTGGIETVKKVVWGWLLTRIGEIVHAPGFGTRLRHKQTRPADLDLDAKQLANGLSRGIPWVDSASVRMEFTRDNHIRVGVRVRAFGEIINETRTVSAS